MNVLAFAASNSRKSINGQLIAYAASLLQEGPLEDVDVEIIQINDFEMPLYSIDREEEGGIPDLAHQFYRKIGESDALLISYAEHNGSYTAAFKNLFDWTSRIDTKVYQGKPAVMLATSPGPGGAGNVLASAINSAPHFGAVLKAELSVARFYDNFDLETGRISNTEIQADLALALASLR